MEGNSNQLLVMRHVYSNEFLDDCKNIPVQVLRDISLNVERGQVWSVLGDSFFSIRLLAEILSNSRAYQKGECSLSGHGMMRSKGKVLGHTFYIGSTNMMFDKMLVLEYLMFATSKNGTDDAVARQKAILGGMIEIGLDYIALTPVELLTPEEKAIVILYCASLSGSSLIVMNLPRLVYDTMQADLIKKIAVQIANAGKSLILTTGSFDLAQFISTDILILQNGAVRYDGGLADLLTEFDKILFSIRTAEPVFLMDSLKKELPQFGYRLDPFEKDTIDMIGLNGAEDPNLIFGVLGKIGHAPQAVTKNYPNLRNAYDEVMKQNDL